MASIVQVIKSKIYDYKLKQLLYKGIKSGEITEFDEELYKQMSQTFIGGLPVSISLKYLKPSSSLGKCIDRSLYMFFCFDNAILVRGDCEDLARKYGNEGATHGWIEIDGYVYDPSLLLKFKKELYYELYKPTNVSKKNKDEFCSIEENKLLYEGIKNTSIEDFKPYCKRRLELGSSIPLAKVIAKNSGDANFVNDLNAFLTSVEYDEEEVMNEINEKYRMVFGPKHEEK